MPSNTAFDTAIFSKRYIIETINDQLKNISQIVHRRDTSENGVMTSVMSALAVYCLEKKKLKIKSEDDGIK